MSPFLPLAELEPLVCALLLAPFAIGFVFVVSSIVGSILNGNR